jgi:hypothetical protein
MRSDRSSNRKDFHVKIRSADLDAPTLIDEISADLLDHLIACRRCSIIFAAQKHSLGEAGCVEGRRISSQTKLRWQERRSSLALQHLTEQTVDDYLFDRLSCDEQQPLAHHLSCCLQCAETIEERKTLATWIRRAFDERRPDASSSGYHTAVLQIQFPERALSLCFKTALGEEQ